MYKSKKNRQSIKVKGNKFCKTVWSEKIVKDIIHAITHKRYALTIRFKLTAMFVCTCLIIFVVNIFMYVNVSVMTDQLNEVYITNINLNELSDTLASVQANMTDYLNTKGSQSLQGYYHAENKYSKLLNNLNTTIVDNPKLLMEKNIKNMSEAYLLLTSNTVQAKRGRNVEKYNEGYEEASMLFTYISNYINSLNNQQFKTNSNNFEAISISLGYLKNINTTVLISAIILSVFLVYMLTRSITNPLNQLAKAANEVAKGNFDIERVEVKSSDEVGIVSKAFNKMIVSIKEYISQIKINLEKENLMKENELIMAGHLKDAQLKYLQAQINPHFLFNTLNAGAQLAMMEDASKTCLFIENMADFFRYNIKKINEDATLEEEIRLVDNYVYIINVRFSGEIHYEKVIQEDLLKVRVPSMILQPIVENAINYGVRDAEGKGKIKMKIYAEDDQIYISIKDNGIGIEPNKIEHILSDEIVEADLSKNANGIGLRNVINRLKLYFQCEDVIEIVSEGKNKGTEVIIHIPDTRQNEEA